MVTTVCTCRKNLSRGKSDICESCNEFIALSSQYMQVVTIKINSHIDSMDTMPTKARPGTAAKIWVMMQRAARGLQLFHPDDAKLYPTQ